MFLPLSTSVHCSCRNISCPLAGCLSQTWGHCVQRFILMSHMKHMQNEGEHLKADRSDLPTYLEAIRRAIVARLRRQLWVFASLEHSASSVQTKACQHLLDGSPWHFIQTFPFFSNWMPSALLWWSQMKDLAFLSFSEDRWLQGLELRSPLLDWISTCPVLWLGQRRRGKEEKEEIFRRKWEGAFFRHLDSWRVQLEKLQTENVQAVGFSDEAEWNRCLQSLEFRSPYLIACDGSLVIHQVAPLAQNFNIFSALVGLFTSKNKGWVEQLRWCFMQISKSLPNFSTSCLFWEF